MGKFLRWFWGVLGAIALLIGGTGWTGVVNNFGGFLSAAANWPKWVTLVLVIVGSVILTLTVVQWIRRKSSAEAAHLPTPDVTLIPAFITDINDMEVGVLNPRSWPAKYLKAGIQSGYRQT